MVNLLCSQTKVCPNSKITLHRLELLAQFLAHIQYTYKLRKPADERFAFFDTRITLNWIHSTTRKWKPFDSNRVVQIRNSLSPSCWLYVPTQESVSDCSTWLSGPTWLKLPFSDWPIKPLSDNQTVDHNDIVDHESVLLSVIRTGYTTLCVPLIGDLSSWSKLLHSTIYVFDGICMKFYPIDVA